MPCSTADRDILRPLAEAYAQAASAKSHKEKMSLWKQLNGLDAQRPMVWINEICWGELEALEDELRCRCEDPTLRAFESDLRRHLYQGNHLPCDMTLEPCLFVNKVFDETGYGIAEDSLHSGADRGAAEYRSVIRTLDDVEKIQNPTVTLRPEETQRRLDLISEIVGDILPVKVRGIVSSQPRAMWDVLICFYGIDELMLDMIDNPQLVHAAADRMTAAILNRHEQYEQLGLLALNNRGNRVGTGALGWTDELPADDFNGEHVRMIDCWGGQMAQIFSGVSPAMHEEFALHYELRILEKFGLNYYGCCEPLDRKLDLMKQIPRLRKVSMSPYVDWRAAAEGVGQQYVFSAKPNPAVLATESWHPEQARTDLQEILEATRGCHVEIIMKDIHTLRNEPRRLWEWAEIAMEEVLKSAE